MIPHLLCQDHTRVVESVLKFRTAQGEDRAGNQGTVINHLCHPGGGQSISAIHRDNNQDKFACSGLVQG